MVEKAIKKYIQRFKYKNIRGLTYDDARITPLMYHNVKEHKFVRRVYESFYDIFLSAEALPEGALVELGTGYGFFKEYSKKKIIRSDINSDFNIDVKFSAQMVPLKNNSVSSFFMLGVLHHIKDVDMFFVEVMRTLKPKGRLIMIEPFNSPLARFFYSISHSESFDTRAGWKISGSKHLSDANLALPWIIFFRDRKLYESKYPKLKIKRIELHNCLLFQLSGAGAFNTFLPGFLFPLIRHFERMLKPFYKYLAMWTTIELEKM